MSRQALRVAAFALAFRLFSAVLAFYTNIVFPEPRPAQFSSVFRDTPIFWDSFTRHDSGWYHGIARDGYYYTPGGRSSIAFFPAYPLLMRYVGALFGSRPSDTYLGGIAVSWVAFICAAVGLFHLARLDLSDEQAERTVLLMSVFPFAFFFGAVYTEALFLAAAVGAFYFFRTRRYILGGLCGALVTATRVNGILIWPALAWLAWQATRPGGNAAASGGSTLRRERIYAAVGLLLVPAGIGLYSLFIYRWTGNPLEWAATLQRWGYYPGGQPWLVLFKLVGTLFTEPYTYLTSAGTAPYDTLNGIAAILFVAAVPFVWMRYGAAYGLFMAANLWLPLSSGVFEGMGRYCAVMFPFFIWIAGLRSRYAFEGVLVVFALFYTLCLALFTNIHPLF
jgi:hypothetical protein